MGDGDGRDATGREALDLLRDLAEIEFGDDEGLDLLGQGPDALLRERPDRNQPQRADFDAGFAGQLDGPVGDPGRDSVRDDDELSVVGPVFFNLDDLVCMLEDLIREVPDIPVLAFGVDDRISAFVVGEARGVKTVPVPALTIKGIMSLSGL